MSFFDSPISRCEAVREMVLTDRSLLRFVRRMQDLPGQHLFQYLDAEGAACPVASGDVNAYLRETMGEDFTAKHFRTWHASTLAFALLAAGRERLTVKALAAEVSERLGNTPAIARKSYIHPAVLALVDRQEDWRRTLRLPRATRWLSRPERGLIAWLETTPTAHPEYRDEKHQRIMKLHDDAEFRPDQHAPPVRGDGE